MTRSWDRITDFGFLSLPSVVLLQNVLGIRTRGGYPGRNKGLKAFEQQGRVEYFNNRGIRREAYSADDRKILHAPEEEGELLRDGSHAGHDRPPDPAPDDGSGTCGKVGTLRENSSLDGNLRQHSGQAQHHQVPGEEGLPAGAHDHRRGVPLVQAASGERQHAEVQGERQPGDHLRVLGESTVRERGEAVGRPHPAEPRDPVRQQGGRVRLGLLHAAQGGSRGI